MTTIIAHKEDRRFVMYADTRLTSLYALTEVTQKLYQVDAAHQGPLLFGVSGRAHFLTNVAFASKAFGGIHDLATFLREIDKDDGHTRFLVTNGRKLWYLSPDGFVNDLSRMTFYTIGSGASYAMGALSAGASPRQAMRIAMKWDTGTGGRVVRREVGT